MKRSAWGIVLLLGLAGCGDGGEPATADLVAMRKQIHDLERRLDEQAQQHEADRKLLLRALNASSDRLDTVIGALLAKAGDEPTRPPTATPDPDRSDPDRTDPRTAHPGTAHPGTAGGPTATSGNRSAGGDTDGSAPPATGPADAAGFDYVGFLVTFLAVALLLLVLLVVFFPGRLRGAVPQVEYSALDSESIEEEAIAGLQDDLYGPTASRTSASVAPRPAAFAPQPVAGAPDDERPVAHELAIQAPAPEELTSLAEVLDRFLSTDPYILNEPAPQVALVGDELRLRFYALPNLSEAEHALLDDAVRRLTPATRVAEGPAPTQRGVG